MDNDSFKNNTIPFNDPDSSINSSINSSSDSGKPHRHKVILDGKILKICIYAAVTALVTFGLGVALYHSGPFWSTAGSIISAVLKPVIAGIVIAYLLMPLTNFFDRKFSHGKEMSAHPSHIRALSVLLTIVILLAVIAVLVLGLAVTVNKSVRSIDLDKIKALGTQFYYQYKSLIDQITEFLNDKGFSINAIAPQAMSVVKRIADFFKVMLFGLIFAVYFLYDGVRIGSYWKGVARTLLSDKVRVGGRTLLADADRAFSGYIRGQVIDAVIVFFLVSVAMLIAKVPFALVIGFMTGFGNLIPYMGPIFGYGSVILTSLVSGNVLEHPAKMITGIVILAIIQFIDGNIINPRLLSNQIKIHPLFVIACIIAGGTLGGFLGMLIAVPVGALIKVQFERFLEKRHAAQVQAK